MAFTIRPEVQAAVDAMPPLRPEQIAELRLILHDWPARIRERVEARQHAADDAA
ncbi:hypothetical protein GCM10023196_036160 [Actinoallomurus vinaceus]|uniref:Uncharacterized protein n=1 Tax=Actinoallomurus vinaceus TaxID=1080074 RepID=A0ABP8U984_9ACTN